MSLKKNTLSYIIWMIMLLFTGATVAFMGMVVATRLTAGNSIWMAAGFVAVFFLILFLIYLLTGFIMARVKPMEGVWNTLKNSLFVEGIILGLCVSAGVAIRIYLLPTAGEDAAYFDLAKVTEQGGTLVQAVQVSVYYYCMLLHGFLRIFGNHWIVGIWLQIFLQAFSSIWLYFAVRKLVGKAPAFLFLLFLSFAPVSIEAGLTYSPQILYLCIFGIAFFMVADYLHRCENEEEYPVLMWLYTVLVGVAIGFVSYVDVSGLVLLLLFCCMGMVRKKEGAVWFWLLRFLIGSLCAVGAFGGMLFLEGLLNKTAFMSAWNAWLTTYSSVEWNLYIFTEKRQLELLILPMLAAMGVFSFWRRRNGERFSACVLLVFGIAVLHFAGITTDNMDGSYLLYASLAVLAGVALSELFYKAPEKAVAVQVVVPEVSEAGIAEPVGATAAEAKTTEAVVANTVVTNAIVANAVTEKEEVTNLEKNEQPKAETNMIENPLPVPKKKARKGMDYAFIPKPSQMMYDIRVSDADDFDI